MKKTTLIAAICAITILAAPATTYARDNTGAIVGSIFGGCPNTTYGESVGCVAITKNASIVTIITAAILSILVSFISPFVAFLDSIPGCVMGGVCITLYGFIAVSGLKMIQKVDLEQNANLFTVSVILISGIGGLSLTFGKVTITAIACALILGIIVGITIGCLTCKTWANVVENIPYILGIGIKMGAVMELIPRITALFIEGLKPISDATRELINKKFKGAKGLNIGMSPALVIGHPTTLVASLILIPITLLLAVVLPGNEFLPLASLAGMFYIFPLILPITKGNVVKSLIIGVVVIVLGLYFVTNLADSFTLAALDVYEKTGDVKVPEGFEAGSLDFASSPLAWAIYHLTYTFKWIGASVLVLITMGLMFLNRRAILKYQKETPGQSNEE